MGGERKGEMSKRENGEVGSVSINLASYLGNISASCVINGFERVMFSRFGYTWFELQHDN